MPKLVTPQKPQMESSIVGYLTIGRSVVDSENGLQAIKGGASGLALCGCCCCCIVGAMKQSEVHGCWLAVALALTGGQGAAERTCEETGTVNYPT